MEIWKYINGYFGRYEVSSFGRVKSHIYRGHPLTRILKLSIDTGGYPIVKLYFNKKSRTTKVHRLVAEAFILNPNRLPQVNHKDGNKQNNNVDNLEWCTCLENQKHAWRIGIHKKRFGEECFVSRFTEKQIKEIREKAGSCTRKALAKEYGMSETNVSDIVKRKIWTHI